jgi:dsRNA-specific ribonuclease
MKHVNTFNPYNIYIDNNFNIILKKYGYDNELKDITLFQQAFINKSYCTRKNQNISDANVFCPKNCIPLQKYSNERLEFLGDAILHLIISEYLYDRYPKGNQAFLTKIRTLIVNGKCLAKLSRSLGLGEYMIISKQVEDKNGRINDNLLEDTFEAFIGAMFRISGYDITEQWLIRVIEKNIDFSRMINTEQFKYSTMDMHNRNKFISDALLNTHVGEYLFRRYFKKDEGFLTTMRSKLINKNMISHISSQCFQNENQFEIEMIELYFSVEKQKRYKKLNDFICNTIEESIDFVSLINYSNYKDDLFKFFQHNMSTYPVISIQKYKDGFRASISTKSNESISYAISSDKKIAEQEACKRALQYYGKKFDSRKNETI